MSHYADGPLWINRDREISQGENRVWSCGEIDLQASPRQWRESRAVLSDSDGVAASVVDLDVEIRSCLSIAWEQE